MTKEEMTALLQDHIPLCHFMQMECAFIDRAAIRTQAPIEPNKNMHDTGFAGSLYALAVATGWGLVHNRITLAGIVGQLVVKEATIHYKRPVTSDITLQAELDEKLQDKDIENQLNTEKRATFPIIVSICCNGKKCGYLEANYVVVRR